MPSFAPVRFAAAALAVALATGAAAGDDVRTELPHPPHAPIARATLANGLRVFVLENHNAPVAQVSVWYRFGSANEAPGKTGLAHALEHMMFRGTPELSEAGRDDLEARLGIDSNAETDTEYTRFYATVPAPRLAVALRVEADAMRNLLLRQRDWEVERGAVLEEYDAALADPERALEILVRRAAYKGTPWEDGPFGLRRDIARLSALDLRRAYDAAYGPNDATLVVTGDVDPLDVLRLARETFGAIRPTAHVAPPPPEHAVTRGFHVVTTSSGPGDLVDVALEGAGNLAPDAAAESVAATLIGADDSAVEVALVDHGPCSSLQVTEDEDLRGGLYHVVCRLPESASTEAVPPAVVRALRTLAARLPEADLVAAKRRLLADAVFADDSISAEGDRAGFALAMLGRELAETDAAIARVTAADVVRVLLRWSAPVGTGISRSRRHGSVVAGAKPMIRLPNFAERPASLPDGEIVQPAWARAAIAQHVHTTSRVRPAVFALPNGLRVAAQPLRGNRTAYLRATLEDPDRYTAGSKPGAAEIAAELFASGSARWPSEAIARAAAARAMTLELGTTTSGHGFAADLPLMLEIVADAARNPRITAGALDKARASAVAAAQERARDPDALAGAIFARRVADPDARDPQPLTAAQASRVTLDDVRAFFATVVRPEHVRLTIVADADPSALRAEVERALGDWRAAGPAPTPRPLLRKQKHVVRYVRVPRRSVRVRLGQIAPDRSDDDFFPMMLLNQMLGARGGFDTRLMRELRIRRGLVYGVSSEYDVTPRRGNLLVRFDSASWNVATAVAVTKQILSGARAAPPGADELDRAREKLVAATLRDEESADGILDHADVIARNALPPDYFQRYPEHYAAVAPPDVQRVARAWLRPDALIEVYEGVPR